MRLAHQVLAALVLLAALVPGAQAAAVVAEDDRPLRLEVLDLAPHVLRPDGTVSVRALLRNTGTDPVSDLSVRLMAYSPRLPTREAVHAWATSDYGIRAGDRFLSEQPVDLLAAGEAVPVALDAPAAELGLPTTGSSWGPRGLTLEVLDDEFDQLAVARGFTVWDPRDEPGDQTTVSLLVPLTAGPPDVATGLLPPERVAELTAEDGRLARVLEIASAPQVGWAVDPAVLASAAAAAEATTGDRTGDPAAAAPTAAQPPATGAPSSPSPDGTASPDATGTTPDATTGVEPAPGEPTGTTPAAAPEAGRWLEQVRADAAGRTVLTLPRSDPDLVGLADAGAGDLYTLAARMGRLSVADLLDTPATSDVAWPVAGTAGQSALSLAAASGVGTVVLSGGAQPPVEPVAGTPSGRSTVEVGEERLDGLLVDTSLSTTFSEATQQEGHALASSRLLAETAAITRGSREPPHVLIALPRDWDPDVEVAAEVMQALRSAPWVHRAGLRELLDRAPDDVRRSPVSAEATGPAALPADGLRDVQAGVREARRISSALTRPDELLDEVEQSAVAATAVAWRDDLERWRAAVGRFGSAADAVAAGIHVVEGSTLTVVSSEVDLPVTVANELAQEVEVVVSVQPRTSRLVAESDVEVTIAPRSTERVAVPVRALANGDTDVVVAVRAPDGALLGEPVAVEVRVRADWETRGMLVTGAVLAGVLVVGLARTIRRGRRRGAAPGGAR